MNKARIYLYHNLFNFLDWLPMASSLSCLTRVTVFSDGDSSDTTKPVPTQSSAMSAAPFQVTWLGFAGAITRSSELGLEPSIINDVGCHPRLPIFWLAVLWMLHPWLPLDQITLSLTLEKLCPTTGYRRWFSIDCSGPFCANGMGSGAQESSPEYFAGKSCKT